MEKTGLIWPNWSQSIVNLAATCGAYLGKPTTKATLPLVTAALNRNYQNIVYLVIDGMGQKILDYHLPAASFLRAHTVQTLTSVFPSTTVSATTSLMSGQYPAEHGWFAWAVDFDGAVIEMFRNRDTYTKVPTADPDFAKHQRPYEYFFQNMRAARTVYAIMPERVNHIIDVKNYQKYAKLSTMCRQIRQICRQPGAKVLYCYHSDLDSTMHTYGPKSRQTRHLLTEINRKLQKTLLKCPDTLFIVTADHGQVDVGGYTYICDDQAILDCLSHPISLDPRAACFFVKPDKKADFEAAFAKYQDDFQLFPTDELLQRGLFGPVSTKYRAQLGDYIALGTATAKMLVLAHGREYRSPKRRYAGEHTGLTPDEMLVPLILADNRQVR